jgi:hypothetical protein
MSDDVMSCNRVYYTLLRVMLTAGVYNGVGGGVGSSWEESKGYFEIGRVSRRYREVNRESGLLIQAIACMVVVSSSKAQSRSPRIRGTSQVPSSLNCQLHATTSYLKH